MDRQIRRLGYALVVLFVLLFVQVNYIQVIAANRIANNPANTTRLLIQAASIDRGDILARDGKTVLAESTPTRGEFMYQRKYPEGSLYADVTGYYPLFGAPTDLESSYNDFLSGRATELLPSTLVDQILGRPRKGGSVVTTIDPNLQKVASDQLGGRAGAVVAMDPSTGELLVMVSNPTFDPNPLASHDAKTAQSSFQRLEKDPAKPLLANANDQLNPPGSTFKLVTAAAALEGGVDPNAPIWDNPPGSLDLPLTSHNLSNFGGETCPGGSKISLAQALTVSCNVVFGEVGMQVGAKALAAQAHAFGFDQNVAFNIGFAEGQFPDPKTLDAPQTAFSAIGQGSVLANPLQMAMVGSAIANGGTLMRPQLVEQVRDSQGNVVRAFKPDVYGHPISAQTASDLTSMMISVVNSGTAQGLNIPGNQMAAKTGTAQHGDGSQPPHAWFVAFAPASAPQLVVAVLVLDGGNLGSDATGAREAGPIARAVLEASLQG
ncbi:MAG: penicillin-binding transpeptidase domain-containing protein [Actinomycetota bacterium]|nr:penicillin-binding transpeptidase domain-containing protein [Actinomycetota bacterium]